MTQLLELPSFTVQAASPRAMGQGIGEQLRELAQAFVAQRLRAGDEGASVTSHEANSASARLIMRIAGVPVAP